MPLRVFRRNFNYPITVPDWEIVSVRPSKSLRNYKLGVSPELSSFLGVVVACTRLSSGIIDDGLTILSWQYDRERRNNVDTLYIYLRIFSFFLTMVHLTTSFLSFQCDNVRRDWSSFVQRERLLRSTVNCARYDLRPCVTNNESYARARQFSDSTPILKSSPVKMARQSRKLRRYTSKVHFSIYVKIYSQVKQNCSST